MEEYEKMIFKNRMNKIKHYVNELLGEDLTMEEITAMIAESFYNKHHLEIEKVHERKREKRGLNQ